VTSARVLTLLATLAQSELPGDEGPLRNDAFVPVAAEAVAELELGDREWERGRPVEAFDAWQRALERSQVGEGVALRSQDPRAPYIGRDPDGTHARRTEGVAVAVLRRLFAQDEGARGAWRARFEPSAEARLLEAETRPDALAALERAYPLTAGAFRAALRLADQALERADSEAALTWLERAERHASGAAESSALRARRDFARELEPGEPPAADAWQEALDLELESALPLEGRVAVPRSLEPAPLGRGIEPGLAFLADGSIVVQSPYLLIRIDAQGRLGRFPLSDLLGTPARLFPFASRGSGGWGLLPATDGFRVALVVGRSSPAHANVLACVTFDAQGFPVPQWTLSSETGLRRGGAEDGELVLGEGRWDFQPGPLVVGGRLFVQARQVADDEGEGGARGDRVFLLALDLATGAVLWERFVTKASDLSPDVGRRFGGSVTAPTSGQPLASARGRVFVGTNLGVAALFDAVDGRLAWTFKNRRRTWDEEGWPGSRAPLVDAAGDVPRVHWAPFDAGHLYVLRLEPGLGGALLDEPPRAIGQGLDVVAADAAGTLVLARAGGRRALATWRPEGSATSLYLGRAEQFTGAGLASSARALVASDAGLYLFDRSRDLFLFDFEPLTAPSGSPGGTLYARKSRVFVLGENTLWTLRVP